MASAGRLAGRLAEISDEGGNLRHIRLVPPPFHVPRSGLRFLGNGLDGLQLEQRAAEGHVLLHAELGELLHAVDLCQTAHVVQQYIRLVTLGLDQRGGELGGIDRQQFDLKLAAQSLQILAKLSCRLWP